MNLFSTLTRWFPWMARRRRVFALVGKSGTGKSFKARQVARRFRVDFIIDARLPIEDMSPRDSDGNLKLADGPEMIQRRLTRRAVSEPTLEMRMRYAKKYSASAGELRSET